MQIPTSRRLRLMRAAPALAVAMTVLIAAPAARAGGSDDCCADLEARIAELEETTARKGNRRVSVTVSGWVNEAIFAWDDGTERNAYVGTNFVEQSRFRFVGEAKIDKDWTAGYLLEVGVQGHPSNQWDQFSIASTNLNPTNGDNSLIARKSNWFIKSKQLGQFAVGLNAMATYHLLDDADSTLTRNVNDAEGAAIFMSAFRIRANGQFVRTLKWTDVMRGFANSTPGDGLRRDIVRYDTPTWKGFSASATWGEDDIGDVVVGYKGDIGDFSVLARAGYGMSNDPGTMTTGPDGSFVVGGTTCISGSTTVTSLPNFSCEWGGAGATVMHKPTGLFLYGGWGQLTVHTDHVFPTGTAFLPTSNTFFLQPGIERKWLSVGKTNIFGQYRHDDPGSNPGRTVSANIDFWQGGFVQNFEAADMSVYIVYQHSSGDITGNAATVAAGAPIGTTTIDPFQELVMGTKINF
jgi:predicted porin